MPDLGSLLRVVVSLGLVLALLWVAARYVSRSRAGASAGVDVDVLARVPLAQKSSLAIVRLGEQALVLGITESRVELLTQAPVAEVAIEPVQAAVLAASASHSAAGPVPAVPVPAGRVAARRSARQATPSPASSPLAGSVLSPHTWTKAVAALREMTVRQ